MPSRVIRASNIKLMSDYVSIVMLVGIFALSQRLQMPSTTLFKGYDFGKTGLNPGLIKHDACPVSSAWTHARWDVLP